MKAGYGVAFCLALWSWICPSGVVTPAAGSAPEHQFSALNKLLDQWQVEEADHLIRRFLKNKRSGKQARYLAARLFFLEGDYEKSLSYLKRAGLKNSDRFYKLVSGTLDETRGMEPVESERYRFLVKSGSPDSILVPYAVQALDAQVKALSLDLGWTPPKIIRIEIAENLEGLSRLTGLSVQAIKTSGTIAVAKYNKLMVTTPRALLKGYRWVRTVCHELTHMALSQVSLNKAPLWLQEGLAKTLEGRYRRHVKDLLKLDRYSEHVLALALSSGKLLSFSKLRPSFAYLPSRESMMLAFAQVKTLVGMLIRDKGMAGIREFLSMLASGVGEDSALVKVYKADFNGLLNRWKTYVNGLGLKTVPGLVQDFALEFAKKGVDPDKHEQSMISEKRVKNHLLLGDMLFKRERVVAAAVEYERADKASNRIYPLVKRRLARALAESDRISRAVKLLDQGLEFSPHDPSLLVDRGLLALQQGDDRTAARLMESAVRVSPFDPVPHRALMGIYSRAGDIARRDRERHVLGILVSRLEER
ncbi:MAG: tetratricopeptide repeat protein [Deltaproteobacteria bacterium]|nr:tetratricopeptide repeat protein [Deltaproteobacteria bacterium]